MRKRIVCFLIFFCFLFFRSNFQQVQATGILIPSLFSATENLEVWLEEVEVEIQDFFVHTKVSQIFYNSSERDLEGIYMFTLPEGAFLTAFATWEGETRLVGQMLEKEKARQLYGRQKNLYLDPGLLEQVDSNLFETRIFPIPAYGTKKVELEYRQTLSREGARLIFSYPLLGSGDKGKIKELNFKLEAKSLARPENVKVNMTQGHLTTSEEGFSYNLKEMNYKAQEDLYFTWELPNESLTSRFAQLEDKGLLLVTLLPELETLRQAAIYHLSLDLSASMRGWPLEKAKAFLIEFLASLEPQDHFNLETWALGQERLWPQARPATTDNLAVALDWLTKQEIRKEGSNLGQLFSSWASLPKGTKVILLSDGQATFGSLDTASLLEGLPSDLDLNILALGYQVRGQLVKDLLGEGNNYQLLSEGSPIEESLRSLWAALASQRISGLDFQMAPNLKDKLDFLPTSRTLRLGSQLLAFASFEQAPRGTLRIEGWSGEEKKVYQMTLEPTNLDSEDDFLPYHWARARIDLLLEGLAQKEDEELKAEVIKLSKDFNIVTPYTSFLAAPRAVLRPRVIKPGDPLLSVSAPQDTAEVTVIFPFGEIVPASYNKEKGLWECRFLVPKSCPDGTYLATIIIVSRAGVQTSTEQSFIIDSQPPSVKAHLKPATVKAGEELEIWADASADTIILTAHLPWGEELDLRWEAEIFYSRGYFRVPQNWPAGNYKIKVVATDRAFNMGATELELTVLPSGEVN